MPSNTKVTRHRRRRKQANAGKKKARKRAKAGTPKFPINPE